MEQRSDARVTLTGPERRSEPRIETTSSVVITPLAAVGTRYNGSVVNISKGGVRVHFNTKLKEPPRVGDVYRVQSRVDIMLCEVRNSEVAEAGADLGLRIVHWGDAGELKSLLSKAVAQIGLASSANLLPV